MVEFAVGDEVRWKGGEGAGGGVLELEAAAVRGGAVADVAFFADPDKGGHAAGVDRTGHFLDVTAQVV